MVLVKDKQGSVCSILGVWVAVCILSLPIPAQPGLATGLEWKALSLSVADDTPRLSFPRSVLWLSIVVKKVLGKTLLRARAASRRGKNRCWQRL